MGNYFRTTPQVEIVEEPVSVPRHDTFYASIIATGQKGRDPGELYYPYGVAIHEETHQIIVSNMFSMTELRYSLRRESSFINWV